MEIGLTRCRCHRNRCWCWPKVLLILLLQCAQNCCALRKSSEIGRNQYDKGLKSIELGLKSFGIVCKPSEQASKSSESASTSVGALKKRRHPSKSFEWVRNSFIIYFESIFASVSKQQGALKILKFLRTHSTGFRILRNHFRNRCSHTLDSVPLHSAPPAPSMECSGQF